MKAATLLAVYARKVKPISIHAAREGGDHGQTMGLLCLGISIHAAREGGDHCKLAVNVAGCRISIHAAREGGDAVRNDIVRNRPYFNPRRP